MNAVIKATITIGLAIFLSILISCGGRSNYCTPNYIQGNLGLRVTYLSNVYNEFQFEVCYNTTSPDQFTVYGFELEGDIATISAADARGSHITDNLTAGATFSVTFNNNDAWFAIYADDNSGNFAFTDELIRGEFR